MQSTNLSMMNVQHIHAIVKASTSNLLCFIMRIAFFLSKELEQVKNQKSMLHDLHGSNKADYYTGNVDIRILQNQSYDVIFYDLSLDPSFSIQIYKHLLQQQRRPKIILLSNKEVILDFKKIYKRGVNGIIAKELPHEELSILINNLLKNFQLHYSSKKNSNNPYFSILTDREKQIIKLFINGFSYKEVAHHLDVSLDTVRSHIRNIYKKLNVRSKTEAVMKVMESNIID